MKSYLFWFHMKSTRFYWNSQNFTVFLLDQQDFTWNSADYTKTSGFHEIHSISQDYTFYWNQKDFIMDFTVDFIMNSLQISLVGIHREIHNEILFVLISHEIQQITQKLVDFMISHRISLKPIGFHMKSTWFHKIWGISWWFNKILQNLEDFMKSNRMSLQPTIWNPQMKSNHMLLKSTEFHSISLKPKGLHMKSRRLHKN